jgi:membrane-associated phospholipid phosphatase
MKFLTDFGDSAVLLPLSAVMLIWLLATRPAAAGVWWGVALTFLSAVISTLKILFFACPPAADINSPSGHTGFSLVVYGGLAVIIAAELRSIWARAAVLILAVVLVFAIADSRVMLEMHTSPETVIGFAVGAFALAIFRFGYLRTGPGKRRIVPLIIGIIVTAAIFHGIRLNPERELHMLSSLLGLRRLFCPH